MLADAIYEGYPATFALTYDQTVEITESFYPSLSFTKLFSDLGGSLGFWLGLGLIQLLYYAVDTIDCIKVSLKLNKK